MKDTSIIGKYEYLGAFDSKDQCANEVKVKYPNATGVEWYEDNNNCYARYGNKLTHYSGIGAWSCLREGN